MILFPPLWFYMINPRVEALEDLKNGKKGNKTCYDYIAPFTPSDERIMWVGWTFLAAF